MIRFWVICWGVICVWTTVYARSGSSLVDVSYTRTKEARVELGGSLSSEWIYAQQPNDWSHRYLLTIPAVFHLKALTGYSLGSIFVQGLALKEDGDFVAGRVAVDDIHAHSNAIAGEDQVSLYEIFWEQEWDSVLFRLGKIDANDHFAVSESMGHFMNGAAGFSPSIYGLPSYPDSAWCTQLWSRHSLFDVGGAIFDGGATQFNMISTGSRILPSQAISDGSFFMVGQVNLHWDQKKGSKADVEDSEYTFDLHLGYWGHTGYVRSVGDPLIHGGASAQGGFATFDYKSDDLGMGSVLLGMQAAYSQFHVEMPSSHYALAVVWLDWWAGGYGKSMGLEFSRVGFDGVGSSDVGGWSSQMDDEYLLEYTVEFEFQEWLRLHVGYVHLWHVALRDEQASLWFTRLVLGQDDLLKW